MSNVAEHVFDTDLRMFEVEPGVFELQITDRWCINGTPNGGYIMALIIKAMEIFSDKSSSPIVSASYLLKCRPGRAFIHLEMVSRSPNYTRIMARLVQGNEEKVRAFGTFSSDINGAGGSEYDAGPPEMVDFDSAFQTPPMDIHTLMDRIDLRLDPSCVGWAFGEYAKPMQFKGYVRFKEERGLDLPAVFMFADVFPPPVFTAYGPGTWVPTLELSVNVRKIPRTNVLKGVFTSRFISSGLVEEDGELWDEAGDLIALSRQYSRYIKK